MNQQQFIETYCRYNDMSEETFNVLKVALICHCGHPGCTGWAAIPNNPIAIKTHQEMNREH